MDGGFAEVSPFIKDVISNESPLSVLEISGYGTECGRLISECLKELLLENETQGLSIDRVDLLDELLISGAQVTKGTDGAQRAMENERAEEADDNEAAEIYRCIYNSGHLADVEGIDEYDVILIFHLFENMLSVDAKALLEALLKKTQMQVLIITPFFPYDLDSDDGISGVRAYHPVFFTGIDFFYEMIKTTEGIIQAYSFFPKIDYERLSCDSLVTYDHSVQKHSSNVTKKLRIAYILPYMEMMGGMKAILLQMKELKANGHHVTLYCRSDADDNAIPSWSELGEDDISTQVVIPSGALFRDYIHNEDIIVLGFVNLIPEFVDYKIPVALWEQGYRGIFGDNGKLFSSKDYVRMYTHRLYRSPVHILSVSRIISDVLKGVYNRESQLFPTGIDTDVYTPSERKNNDVPVILLVGNPTVELKGFGFALRVLEAVKVFGADFKVWWAMQVDYSPGELSFPLERFVLPSQEKLAELYRNADVFMSTSLYESFSLPPIEAMASGTAVISTDNGGIRTYAEPGSNCLLCEQGDLVSMSVALNYLLQNPEAREMLAIAGRETALKYSMKSIVPQLEQCLYNIVDSRSDSNNANP